MLAGTMAQYTQYLMMWQYGFMRWVDMGPDIKTKDGMVAWGENGIYSSNRVHGVHHVHGAQ